MKGLIILIIVLFVLIGGVVWLVSLFDDTSFFEPRSRRTNIVAQPKSPPVQSEQKHEEAQAEIDAAQDHSTQVTAPVSESPGVSEDEGFPAPTVQIVNGRPERTIHMGVRQYAWDPSVIEAKQGELVRLIIHNADVQHGLVIPDLNVMNIDIPPEGAVIEFEASKVGTFVFFCSYYCGEDHSLMRGKIVIE